jgi:hypothetical protein
MSQIGTIRRCHRCRYEQGRSQGATTNSQEIVVSSSTIPVLRMPSSERNVQAEAPKPAEMARFDSQPVANDANVQPGAKSRCVDVLAHSMADSACGF